MTIDRRTKQGRESWRALRLACIERDGSRCRKCHATRGLEAHHIVARADGGADELANLITLCSICHDDWHYIGEDLGVPIEIWAMVPPSRVLIMAWLSESPEGETLAEFKIRVLSAMDSARRTPP